MKYEEIFPYFLCAGAHVWLLVLILNNVIKLWLVFDVKWLKNDSVFTTLLSILSNFEKQKFPTIQNENINWEKNNESKFFNAITKKKSGVFDDEA